MRIKNLVRAFGREVGWVNEGERVVVRLDDTAMTLEDIKCKLRGELSGRVRAAFQSLVHEHPARRGLPGFGPHPAADVWPS